MNNKKNIKIFGLVVIILIVVWSVSVNIYQAMTWLAQNYRQQGFNMALNQLDENLKKYGSITLNRLGSGGKQETIVLIPKK